MKPETIQYILTILLSIDLVSAAALQKPRNPLFERSDNATVANDYLRLCLDESYSGEYTSDDKGDKGDTSCVVKKLPKGKAVIDPLNYSSDESEEEEPYKPTPKHTDSNDLLPEAQKSPTSEKSRRFSFSSFEIPKLTKIKDRMTSFRFTKTSPECLEEKNDSDLTDSPAESKAQISPSNSDRTKSSSSSENSIESMYYENGHSTRPLSRALSPYRSPSLSEDHMHGNNRSSRRKSNFISIPILSSDSSFLPRQAIIKLPSVRNQQLFGGVLKIAYDENVALTLYANEGDKFDAVSSPDYGLIANMLPLSRLEPSKRLSERIFNDLGEPFVPQIKKAKKYIAKKYKDYPEFFIGNPENEDFRSDDHLIEAVKSIVMCSLGKGSTLDLEHVYKIGEASQRVIFTSRDIFYYPEMLKLALFFNLEFDPNYSNAFFDQFINTFYSGVYGPRRSDLFYIARFQDIPVEVISDQMLVESFKEGNEALLDQIESIKESFLNPKNRISFLEKYKNEIEYIDLNPVPKTVDDVLEATVLVLNHYVKKNDISRIKLGEMKGLIYTPENINHMQSFYMTIFPIENVLSLFGSLVVDYDYPEAYRKHAASFLYAAFIEILRSTNHVASQINLTQLEAKMKEMFQLEIKGKKLNAIHKKSEGEAEVDYL